MDNRLFYLPNGRRHPDFAHFCLQSSGLMPVSINLNLLPVQMKEDLLDMIYDRMEGQIKSKSGKLYTNN